MINCDDSADIEKQIVKVLDKGIKYEFERTYGVYDGVLKVYNLKENVRDLTNRIKSTKIHCAMVLALAD